MKTIEKKRVLIIEDEPIIRRMCSRTLVLQGFEVDALDNGRDALRALINENYAACLSDITMPGMSGIQIYRNLQEKCPQKLKNIIFMTGDMLNQDVKNFVKTLTNPFLAKPFLPDELVQVVKQVVEKL